MCSHVHVENAACLLTFLYKFFIIIVIIISGRYSFAKSLKEHDICGMKCPVVHFPLNFFRDLLHVLFTSQSGTHFASSHRLLKLTSLIFAVELTKNKI